MHEVRAVVTDVRTLTNNTHTFTQKYTFCKSQTFSVVH